MQKNIFPFCTVLTIMIMMFKAGTFLHGESLPARLSRDMPLFSFMDFFKANKRTMEFFFGSFLCKTRDKYL